MSAASSVRVALRPRSAAEQFDLALRLVTGPGARALGTVSAAVLVPCWLALWALAESGASWLLVWGLAALAGVVAQLPLAWTCGRLLTDDDISGRRALRESAAMLPTWLTVAFAGLLKAALYTVLIVLLPRALANTYYLPEVVALERASWTDALKRATEIARSANGAVLGAVGVNLLAGAFFVFSAEQAVDFVLDWVLQLPPTDTSLYDDGGSAAALAGYFVWQPVFAASRYASYLDRRVRRDGFDVQVALLTALESAQTEEGSA